MFKFDSYVCEGDTATHQIDGFTVTATIYRDDCGDKPDDLDEGFWPSRNPNDAGYVLPENYDAEMIKAQRVMDAWKNDEWFYCGVAVSVSKAGVCLTQPYTHAIWGVEVNYPDSANAYLGEVASALMSEALEDARAKLAELATQPR